MEVVLSRIRHIHLHESGGHLSQALLQWSFWMYPIFFELRIARSNSDNDRSWMMCLLEAYREDPGHLPNRSFRVPRPSKNLLGLVGWSTINVCFRLSGQEPWRTPKGFRFLWEASRWQTSSVLTVFDGWLFYDVLCVIWLRICDCMFMVHDFTPFSTTACLGLPSDITEEDSLWCSISTWFIEICLRCSRFCKCFASQLQLLTRNSNLFSRPMVMSRVAGQENPDPLQRFSIWHWYI